MRALLVVAFAVAGAGRAVAEPSPSLIAGTAAGEQATNEEGPGTLLTPGGGGGLLRMGAADAGPPGQARLGLYGEFFSARRFLVTSEEGAGDRHSRWAGGLGFSATPVRRLELFGSIAGASNRNRRFCDDEDAAACASEPDRTDPELLKSFGDTTLGAKLAAPIALGGALSAGGQVSARLLSSVEDPLFDWGATSAAIDALATLDVGRLSRLPVRAHLGVGFRLDNSDRLWDRPAASPGSRVVSAFARGGGHDRLATALGIEYLAPPLVKGLSVRPLLEYHLEVVTASPGEAFAELRDAQCGAGEPGACGDNRDQHALALGLAVQGGGFGATLGVDVGLRSFGIVHGPRLPPYNVVLLISRQLGLSPSKPAPPPAPVVVHVPAPAPKPPPPRDGRVRGQVTARAGAPIDGAVVGVVGRAGARVATDPDGQFTSGPLPAGSFELEVVAPRFAPVRVPVQIIPGQEAAVAVQLEPRPSVITGRLADDTGAGRAGKLVISGPVETTIDVPAAGEFSLSLPAGTYRVRAQADGYLARGMTLVVAEAEDATFPIALRPRPPEPSVALQADALVLKRPIVFATFDGAPSAEMSQEAKAILDEVADLLVNRPDIASIRVESSWVGQAPRGLDLQRLTDAQAAAVTGYLASQGLAPERLVAVGLGAKRAGPRRGAQIELRVLMTQQPAVN